MSSLTVDIRTADRRDARGIAAVHDEAWQLAYAGIIPALHLTRMIQRRGPAWWTRAIERSKGGIMVVAVGETVAGYATLGPSRRVAGLSFDGEIFELYVKPEYQGLGFGTRLFRAARERLAANGRMRVIVWALEANAPALTFYRSRGGKPIAKDKERFGTDELVKIGFGFGIASSQRG